MSAAFGKNLILDEHAGQSRALVGAHRTGGVGDVAEPGIAVAEDRNRNRVAEPGVMVGHLGHRQLRGIGLAEQRGGRGIAAAGDHLKADLFGDARAQRVVHARHDGDLRRLDELAKTAGWFQGSNPVAKKSLSRLAQPRGQ
jgi:hypothetical protein